MFFQKVLSKKITFYNLIVTQKVHLHHFFTLLHFRRKTANQLFCYQISVKKIKYVVTCSCCLAYNNDLGNNTASVQKGKKSYIFGEF